MDKLSHLVSAALNLVTKKGFTFWDFFNATVLSGIGR